jgi:hypothetical protein
VSELKFKPFHNLKFKNIYHRGIEPKRKLMKERKQRVMIDEATFKLMIERYKQGITREQLGKEFDISYGAACKYHDKCRRYVAERTEERKEEIGLKERIEQLEEDIKHRVRAAEVDKRLMNDLRNSLTAKDNEIAKLKTKIEVLTDLVKGN